MPALMDVNTVTFYKELFERDLKHFRVYDSYTPDYKKTLLTGKFYSKYEGPSSDIPDPDLMEKIKKAKYDTPREKYPWPVTENQCYGWFNELLVPVEWEDHRFHHPRRAADFIKHELQLKMEESVLPKAKFTGIPFKVQ